jgi:ribulose-bisphosphate carboxylase large chain
MIDFGSGTGRGVLGHPRGPKGEVASLRQGWEAVQKGVMIDDCAHDHPELKSAIKAFG